MKGLFRGVETQSQWKRRLDLTTCNSFVSLNLNLSQYFRMKYLIIIAILFSSLALSAQQLKVTTSDGTFFTTDTLKSGDLIPKGATLIIGKYHINGYFDAEYDGQYGYIRPVSILQTPEVEAYFNTYIPKPKTIKYISDAQQKRNLIKLYGVRYGTDIFNGTIRMGMTKKMVKEVLGEPSDINRTVTTHSTSEQWVYDKEGSKTEYYYFDNGRLSSWQD